MAPPLRLDAVLLMSCRVGGAMQLLCPPECCQHLHDWCSLWQMPRVPAGVLVSWCHGAGVMVSCRGCQLVSWRMLLAIAAATVAQWRAEDVLWE